MEQIWELKGAKSNGLIVIKDATIYTGHTKQSNFGGVQSEADGLSFVKDLNSIPYRYITSIENQEGGKSIRIYSGKDTEDELIVPDEKVKNEIFQFIKSDAEGFEYKEFLPNVFKYTKAIIFAFIITSVVFLWALGYATELENGTEYELVGGGASIDGIILMMAHVGVVNLTTGYAALVALMVFALVKRLKSRSIIEQLKR